MNLYHCQKMLLKSEKAMEDNGASVLDFTCERTGLHFRLDPVENRIQGDKTAALCRMCEENCQPLREHKVR